MLGSRLTCRALAWHGISPVPEPTGPQLDFSGALTRTRPGQTLGREPRAWPSACSSGTMDLPREGGAHWAGKNGQPAASSHPIPSLTFQGGPRGGRAGSRVTHLRSDPGFLFLLALGEEPDKPRYWQQCLSCGQRARARDPFRSWAPDGDHLALL